MHSATTIFPTPFVPAIRACLLALPMLVSGSAALAQTWSARIEPCAPPPLDPLECQSGKLVIDIHVPHVEATSNEVTYIDTATRDGVPEALPQAVEINTMQAAPRFQYPLVHVRDVDYHPSEEVIKVQNAIPGVQACIDDPGDPQGPHCWGGQGDPGIAYSQGFCCNRSPSDWGDGNVWRGEDVLQDTSTLFNSFSTAHCPRASGATWSGFDFGAPTGAVGVEVEVSIGIATQPFALDLDDLLFDARDDLPDPELNLWAELTGNYGALAHPQSLSGSSVYYAVDPPGDPYVQAWDENVLMIPVDQITVDGTECDKVGTSYQTFAEEQLVCATSKTGDCLHDQLSHLHRQDLDLLGQTPEANTTYLLRAMKNFRDVVTVSQGSPGLFEWQQVAITGSTLHIEIDMADLSQPALPFLGPAAELALITTLVLTFGSLLRRSSTR